jgi:hypothetical protein
MPLHQPCTIAAKHSGREISKAWYVAFSQGHVTTMRIVKHRGEAITFACDLLDRGIELTGTGPMLGTAEQKLDAAAIQRIWREHRTPSEQRPHPGAEGRADSRRALAF